MVLLLLGQPASAQPQGKAALLEALEEARRAEDLPRQAELEYQLGQMSLQAKDTDNALEHFYASLDLHQKSKDTKGQAIAKLGLGQVYLQQGDVGKAIAELVEARQGLSGDKTALAQANSLLGQAHLAQSPPEYGTAKEYLEQAFRMESELGRLGQAARIGRKIAQYDTQLKDYDSALVYLRAVMEIHQGQGTPQLIAQTYQDMARVHQLRQMHPEADGLYQKSLSLYEQAGDSLGMAEALLSLGWNQWESGDAATAKAHFKRCAGMAGDLGLQEGVPSLYQSLSQAMEETGDARQALHWQKEYAAAREAYLGLERQQALLETRAMYESKFEMEGIRHENQQYQLQQRNMRTVRNFLLALVGLALVLLLVLYNNYRRKKKDNLALQHKNGEIQGMNDRLDELNQRLVKEIADRESLEQSSFARDRFLAIMGHRMRQPLNIINGLSQLLLSQEPGPEQANHLRTLQFSANNLAVFINDILDSYNIEAGKISFDEVEFRPEAIVGAVRQRLRLPSQERGVDLRISFSSTMPDTLKGDPGRLEQVLGNILENLLGNAQGGSIQVSLDAVREDARLFLEIRIRDGKHGLSPGQIQILDQGFPTDTQYGEMPDALSGLFISRRLVELQGGKLEYGTGQGTNIHIRLPYAVVEVPSPDKGRPASAGDFSHLSGRTVLLAEDNRLNQLVVSKILGKWGMGVIVTQDGREALEVLGQQYVDLVLMDIHMPVMDGYRATAEIRKSNDPKVRDVPIIALTVSMYLSEKEKARLFGMDDHVGKPFSPEELLGKISQILA